MRYQVFNTRTAGAKPVISAPWCWLAQMLAGLVSHKWPCCRLVDSTTGQTLIEWRRAEIPRMGYGANATTESVKIGPDGTTHSLLIGNTQYGMGQTPEGGHRPLTIVEGQSSVIPREDRSGMLPK